MNDLSLYEDKSFFLARDSSFAQRAICYLSARLSVTRVDQSTTVEVKNMQLSAQMNLFSCWLTLRRNSTWNIGTLNAECESGRRNTQFLGNNSPYIRHRAIHDEGNHDGLIGSCIRAFVWYQNP